MKLVERVREFLDEKCNILVTGFYSDIITELEEVADFGENPIESPIEQLFYIEWKFRQFICNNALESFILHPQYKDPTTKGFVLDFYVDILVEVLNKKEMDRKKLKIITSISWPKIGIEIDSHLWHEKTKEQATRDKKRERILIANGWQLLRFTGSEVYKDPAKCVQETLDFVFKLREEYHKKLKMKFEER